jgi:hypothetical protein
MAAATVKIFAAGTDRREGILSDITLARVHVRVGTGMVRVWLCRRSLP